MEYIDLLMGVGDNQYWSPLMVIELADGRDGRHIEECMRQFLLDVIADERVFLGNK